MIDLAELRTEITTDPEGLSYPSDDEATAALLNAQDRTIPVEPLESAVFGHADLHGYWGRIARLSVMSEAEILAEYEFVSTAEIARSAKQAALGARDRRLSGRDRTIDVNASAFQAMAGLFVAMGVMTQAHHDALTAMGQGPGSRAEELWGVGARVTPSDVANARRLA